MSEQIHIRSVYLQSIEDEEWSAIAAPVYVRGFIRTYARFLGLDPERAVERFNASLTGQGQGHRTHETMVSAAPARRRPSVWLWLASAAALLLVAFVGYNYYQFQTSAKQAVPAVAVDVASPASSDAASPGAQEFSPAPLAKPAAAPTHTLEVRLTQRSWLLVDVDGTERLEGIFPAGTHKEFHGKSALVRAGNAGGVDLTVNGKELGSMGAPGAVIDRSVILAEE